MKSGALYESTFAVAESSWLIHVANAKKLTHDEVIARTGAARRSGVEWTIAPVAEWRETLDSLGIHVDPNRLRLPNDVEFLAARYPLGVLVVASVEVDPDVDPQKNPDNFSKESSR